MRLIIILVFLALVGCSSHIATSDLVKVTTDFNSGLRNNPRIDYMDDLLLPDRSSIPDLIDEF